MHKFKKIYAVNLVVLLLCFVFGCSKKTESDNAKPKRKTELRIEVAESEPFGSAQKKPSAFIRLRTSNGGDVYNQVAPNGQSTIAVSESESAGATYALTITLQKAASLMTPSTSLRAGVYMDGILQHELFLNNTNYKDQGFSGSGSAGATDASRFLEFQIP